MTSPETSVRILEAATRLFAARGYAGTSLQALALKTLVLGQNSMTFTLEVDTSQPEGIQERAQTILASTGGNLSDAVLLQQDRFAVTVSWRNAANETGTGTLAVRSDDSAVFWFFTEVNWELMVKVVNGCAFNQHFWVFSAATTDVEYTLTVTDTVTGAVATYRNALGNAAAAVTDTSAFATCN